MSQVANKMADHEVQFAAMFQNDFADIWEKVYRPEGFTDYDHALNCHADLIGEDWRDLHHIEFVHAVSRTKKVMGLQSRPHKWPRYVNEEKTDFKNYGVMGERIEPKNDELP